MWILWVSLWFKPVYGFTFYRFLVVLSCWFFNMIKCGCGLVNGLVNGLVDGLVDGLVNGLVDGLENRLGESRQKNQQIKYQ